MWLGASLLVLVAAGLLWLGLAPRREPAPVVAPSPPASPPPVQVALANRQNLSGLLARQGVEPADVHRITQALAAHLDLRRLRPGDVVELSRDPAGVWTRVAIRQSPIDIVEARRADGEWSALRVEVPVERRLVRVEGTLRENLFESLEALGERPQLVIDFAEIFAWDFDFASDSQTGDRFRLLVEKVFTGEEFVRYGRILAAEYDNQGRLHTGVYFRHKEESGYYTPAGESMRRSFLKSPLEFTRITSGYSRGRRHPILGGVRPHLAIDYAAPTGTPVWAVADGTVEFVGWKGGNGKTVLLRHRANYKTMYNHLSRFGKGIKPGARVTQRQVIGYVGSTGLSTGPHLDYRVMKDGKFVNPLQQKFIPGKPIAAAARPAFEAARDALLGKLRAEAAPGG